MFVREKFCRRLTLTALGLIGGVVFLCVPIANGADPLPDGLFRAHLEAGEFAPAMAMARDAKDAAVRDALLARIAEAQARAGDRGASIRSAAEISEDRTRSATLAQITGEPWGGRGGGAEPDFDALIELIETTIAPESWAVIGGPGNIAPFHNGVFIDAGGVLRPLIQREGGGNLASIYQSSAARDSHADIRRQSPLRKVSLPRLEKQIQLLAAAGRKPTEAMQMLAGLQRIQYVFVYPDTGDLVLAGPAGDWKTDDENRIVNTTTGQPVVRLDDLVAVFRQMSDAPGGRFGCLIVPRQEALARVQTFLKQSNRQPLPPGIGPRKAWLEKLRGQVGLQDIEIYGIDPRTRAAGVMVEADYRMKLVGMGLEPGVPGVENYLSMVEVPAGEAPPPMSVLRWWFTLDYDAVLAAANHHAFEIRGQGVQVLSENELLTAEGKRVHTGKSEALNRRFARSFTKHFVALCEKYPVYAELRNIGDLALVGALIREEDLAEQVGWHRTCFGEGDVYAVDLGQAPRQVETVINHRMIHRTRILAGVSGGVRIDPSELVKRSAIEIDRYGTLIQRQSAAAAKDLPPDAWWWD